MKNPKISIIMGVYNSEKFLSEAIESILNQTFKDFEFLIINDCSTDNSLEIIKKYVKKDKRIILINSGKNLGRPGARNLGLKKSKGEYIAILDSDDIALPNRLQIQYDFLEKNKEVFLTGGSVYQIDEEGNLLVFKKSLSGIEKVHKRLPKKNCIYHPTVMFRNEGKVFYREKFPYSQDYDLYLRILSLGKNLTNMKEPLIKYRINRGAVSWSKSSKQKLFDIQAQKFYKQRLKKGSDAYENFNPDEILNIDVENSTDKIVLEYEIKGSFRLGDFKKVRKLCRKYFKNHGVFNILLVYYLLSFTNQRFINFLRKISF